ncbi:hypothetical protein M378DRAFT_169988 [Amanita muscaria Koide BX008]|uniref:EamA domain-containing protein n=1 Tax=Amanita muscaria (strain Koide BX008) TaxID=946122 RepID=A0A0C2WRI4_AMAMK|nr:hypothetical protein M378DRAFT_169988 [Amanita muscaria Koide BX008]
MSRDLSPESAERQPLIESEQRNEANKSLLRSATNFIADNAGLLLVVLSQMFFSMMNAAVKLLRTDDPPVSALQVILVRMAITGICSLVYMLSTQMHDSILGPKGVRLLLTFRGITGFVGFFGGYYALQFLSLSDATVLIFLSPLCTAVAGALFLKESFGISQGLSGIVSLVGVVLIARPPVLFGSIGDPLNLMPPSVAVPPLSVSASNPAARLIAVGVALVGVFGITGGYISVRAIGKRAHPLIIMIHLAINCVLIATIGMAVTRAPFVVPSFRDCLALLMIGLFSFVGQILLTMGLQRETAGRASMGLYTQIVFATIFEHTYFHATSSWLSILGTVLILSSASYVAMNKEKPHNHASQEDVTSDTEDFEDLEAEFPTRAKSNNAPQNTS